MVLDGDSYSYTYQGYVPILRAGRSFYQLNHYNSHETRLKLRMELLMQAGLMTALTTLG